MNDNLKCDSCLFLKELNDGKQEDRVSSWNNRLVVGGCGILFSRCLSSAPVIFPAGDREIRSTCRIFEGSLAVRRSGYCQLLHRISIMERHHPRAGNLSDRVYSHSCPVAGRAFRAVVLTSVGRLPLLVDGSDLGCCDLERVDWRASAKQPAKADRIALENESASRQTAPAGLRDLPRL